jgi:uncharacterized membrane protein
MRKTTNQTDSEETLKSVRIQLTTNSVFAEKVDLVLDTGLFGTNRAACLERLAVEGMRHLIKEGIIPKQ